jgi:hypothetical protein
MNKEELLEDLGKLNIKSKKSIGDVLLKWFSDFSTDVFLLKGDLVGGKVLKLSDRGMLLINEVGLDDCEISEVRDAFYQVKERVIMATN